VFLETTPYSSSLTLKKTEIHTKPFPSLCISIILNPPPPLLIYEVKIHSISSKEYNTPLGIVIISGE
jgi:hypothetical protein